MTTFDPTRPLPAGITVLEASAGTGKTHTVASLVVSEVAAGRPLDELLIVTFTRKATGTLRERIWLRLLSAFRSLDPGAPPPDDPVLVHLRRGAAAEIETRRGCLERALADFDAATIATTHGFCQQVLAGLGVAGDAERDLEVVDDLGALVDEAVDDLFVRRFHGGGPVLFDRDAAQMIADAVVKNPDAKIGGVDGGSDEARLRRRFATTLRQRIIEQKRAGRLVTYDDLLSRLANSIEDPARGAIVAERLRRRYSMAIVDEFQDTDTVQWRILRAAFGAPPCRLVLVGDPKQAVYAFRGGDVHAYLRATEGAHRETLDVSWRSDQPLLDALDAYFAGAQLGAPTILHRPLRARPGAECSGLVSPAGTAAPQGDPPLTVRIVDRGDGRVETTPKGFAKKPSARLVIAADLAAEARRILTDGTSIVERDAHGAAGVAQRVRPGDIAVLVRNHRDAETVRVALQQAGVPAVGHGGTSVFATAAARHWLELLLALEQPAITTRLRAVAIGPFFGWRAADLATAADEAWDRIDDRLHDWGRELRRHGPAALLPRIESAEGLSVRLLGQVDGERLLSDLRHVAELLDTWQGAHPSSIAVVVAWLSEQIAGANREHEGSRRRLASDADAVSIHTIHGAKGLEFPIVLLPSLWEAAWSPPDALPVFHDADGERCVGVGGGGAVHDQQVAVAALERDQEELRLLYVALTRARHRVVVWWATGSDARWSPFARVLLGRDPTTGAVGRELSFVPDEAAVRAAVEALAAATAGQVGVQAVAAAPVGPGPTSRPTLGVAAAATVLGVSSFDRSFDRAWTRTSYTGLTEAAHEQRSTISAEVVEIDESVTHDESTTTDDPATVPGDRAPDAGAAADAGTTLPLGDLPGGPRVGTMVHEVLEMTDFAAADLEGELARTADHAGAARLVDGRVGQLVAGMAAALRTPLGPLFENTSLAALSPRDRLDELAFDLPLAGGDHPTGHVTMAGIADVFARTLAPDDPLAAYHERLADPVLATSVRGFLTGSIDLVARVGSRHIVVDYKTNRLAPVGEALTPWHYRPVALAVAMQDAHYPLQAALYAVALHRYLRWRLRGYDPDQHLGGVAYLFLRGMTGPDGATVDGAPHGVFSWDPPTAFVTALSDLLDRGAP